MRLIVTADLHYNHRFSRTLADTLIDRINAARPDALLLVGDTASGDGPELEACLARFECPGPKLFVAGNHELWTHRTSSYDLFTEELPRRVTAAGWHWLEGSPVVLADGVAVAGTVGWYDYSFALPHLGIPRRFYEQKVSPAAAERLAEFSYLLDRTDDISPAGREVAARWNDGRHVKLGRSDEQFLEERMLGLEQGLTSLENRADVRRVITAVHHVPFAELLPPPPTAVTGRAFAGGFLGSPMMGQRILAYPKVTNVFCGHSHMYVDATIGRIHGINIGCGYRWKTYYELDTSDETLTVVRADQ